MSSDWRLKRLGNTGVFAMHEFSPTSAFIMHSGRLCIDNSDGFGASWGIPKPVWQALIRDYIDRTGEDPGEWAKELEETP